MTADSNRAQLSLSLSRSLSRLHVWFGAILVLLSCVEDEDVLSKSYLQLASSAFHLTKCTSLFYPLLYLLSLSPTLSLSLYLFHEMMHRMKWMIAQSFSFTSGYKQVHNCTLAHSLLLLCGTLSIICSLIHLSITCTVTLSSLLTLSSPPPPSPSSSLSFLSIPSLSCHNDMCTHFTEVDSPR